MIKKIVFAGSLLFTINLSAQEKPECLEDVGQKMCLVESEGKYGIIDKKGDYVVPAYFDSIEVFDKGFIVRQKGKYGVIDRKGKIQIPIEYMNVKCAGNCDEDFLYEVSDIGLKAIYISKDQEHLYGFNKVAPTLFAKTTEVSIADYFAFVKDVMDNGYNYNYGYESVLPDTNKVEEKLRPAYRAFIFALTEDQDTYMEKSTFGYYSSWRSETYYHKSLSENKQTEMMNFPVTGITYKQASRYTEWLSTVFETKVNKNDLLSYEIKFRLPTLDEWEAMAANGLSDEMKANKHLDSMNVKGCMLFNFSSTEKCSNYDDFLKNSFGKGSSFNFSFFPDYNGLYCMFGNVAEMLFENGVAKGGSYNHPAKKAAYTNSIEYENAEPWLGFRVVAELKKKNE